MGSYLALALNVFMPSWKMAALNIPFCGSQEPTSLLDNSSTTQEAPSAQFTSDENIRESYIEKSERKSIWETANWTNRILGKKLIVDLIESILNTLFQNINKRTNNLQWPQNEEYLGRHLENDSNISKEETV